MNVTKQLKELATIDFSDRNCVEKVSKLHEFIKNPKKNLNMKITDEQITEFAERTLKEIKKLAKTDLALSEDYAIAHSELIESMKYFRNFFLLLSVHNFVDYCKQSTSIETVNRVAKLLTDMNRIIDQTFEY